jgi:hypothetical protein
MQVSHGQGLVFPVTRREILPLLAIHGEPGRSKLHS